MISIASKGHFSTQIPQDSPRQISSEMWIWSGSPSIASSPRSVIHSLPVRFGGQKF